MSLCTATKKNGSPCRSPAVDGTGQCFWHSPQITDETKRTAARKGGLVATRGRTVLPPDAGDVVLTSPEAALAALQHNASLTRRGELDAKIANSVAYQIGVAVKVWEVAISDRLHRLEKLVNGRVRRR